jgi:pyruvate ferredoxin oxidoreductase gamma subunit
MFEVRIHGRGGQGVVSAAEILSIAAFDEALHAQAFPTFGSERMGAPVTAFCRVDAHPIRLHEPIAEPDCVVVQDPTLLHQVDVFGGLRSNGYVLVNTERTLAALGLDELVDRLGPERAFTLPATALAREHVGRPLPNAALLGGLVALTGVVSLSALSAAIREKFPGEVGERNVRAAEASFAVIAHAPELARA